jgi:hypothetical protein
MANAFASALVVDTITEQAITVLQSRLAPLGAFMTDFSDDVIDPLRGLQIPVVASTGAVTTNPVSFETMDTTVNAAPVTMVHYSKSFGITSAELNQGQRLERLVKINAHALANAIIDAALTPVTTTNFGNAVVTTSANFLAAGGGSQTLWAALKDATSHVLIVDGSLFALMLPTTKESFAPGEAGAYGWDGGVFMNNRWNGAVSNVKALAASPQALAFAARVPALPPGADRVIESGTFTLPDLGITVQQNMWVSSTTRSLYASFDLCFGAGAADKSAAKLGIWA